MDAHSHGCCVHAGSPSDRRLVVLELVEYYILVLCHELVCQSELDVLVPTVWGMRGYCTQWSVTIYDERASMMVLITSRLVCMAICMSNERQTTYAILLFVQYIIPDDLSEAVIAPLHDSVMYRLAIITVDDCRYVSRWKSGGWRS